MRKGFKVLSILLVALLFGMLVTGSAAEKPKFTIVIRMMDMQDLWFRDNIVEAFEKEYDVDITVSVFDIMWDVPTMLELDGEKAQPTINLVKTPKEIMLYMQQQDLIQPYADIVAADELAAAKAEYADTALDVVGYIGDELYFIPRKQETRMMIYLKSKVEDAVNGWTAFEDGIEAALKADNGYGLPVGYELESDPNLWDTYDLFVVAYYWANTEYFGMKMPRMAHRGKKYMGTVTGLTDKAVELGADQDDLLTLDSQPVIDMFTWEAVYHKNGLYNPGMWADPWSGGGIWGAMRDGKVFLAFMHQIDCFFIYGGTHPAMAGYLADPDDLSYAVMPLGVSFELDADGTPLRVGGRGAQAGGWGWAVPKNAPYPDLAWQLARYITNYKNHLAEIQTFGMLPVREDILSDIAKVFPIAWMADVFKTSAAQMDENAGMTAPLVVEWTDVGKVYLDAWYALVVDAGYKSISKPEGVDINKIATELAIKYVPQVKGILGDKYPEG